MCNQEYSGHTKIQEYRVQKYKYILNLYSATTWSATSAKKKSIFKGRTPGWKTQLNSTSCNGRRCEHLFVRISMTLLYFYVSDITFTDLSPVPVRSAVKSYFTSWSIQNLSKRALNRLTEKFSFVKVYVKNWSVTYTMKTRWQAVPGDCASDTADTLARLCSRTWFNINVGVDGSKTTPCTGFCHCGNTVNEIPWRFVDAHQVHEQTAFVSDTVFNGQPMKLLQRRCYTVEQSKASDKSRGGGVEHSLK